MRSSALEACRKLAGEVWRAERKLDRFRTGGLNSEAAVRQRLHAVALELQRASLDEKIALHLYSIDWLNADPLSILERTEGLVERQMRASYASVDALLAERDPASELAIRLLVIQSLGGRLGRWAVRAAEIPDARVARGCYRDLGAPEWSQYCKLTDAANAAFQRADYVAVAPKIFDADRLVRTPAALLTAAVALSHVGDYQSALWTVRVCLLEPEETFETQSAFEGARALEGRLRPSVERSGDRFRPNGEHAQKPFDAAENKVVSVQSVLIRQEVPAAPARPARVERERAQAVLIRDEVPAPPEQVAPTRPMLAAQEPAAATRPMLAAQERPHSVLIRHEVAVASTRPTSAEHVRLLERERILHEAVFEDSLLSPHAHHEMHTEMETAHNAGSLLYPRDAEEVTYIPPEPPGEVAFGSMPLEEEEETQVPPEPELRRLRALAMYEAISAAAGLELADLGAPAVPSPHELTDGLTLPIERPTAPPLSERASSLPTTRIALKRTYEITQVVRARKTRPEEDAQTEQLSIRSPFDRDS